MSAIPRRPRDPIHPASLLPLSYHDRQLVDAIRRPVPVDFVDYIVAQVSKVIRIDEPLPTPPSSPTLGRWWETAKKEDEPLPELGAFIRGLMVQSNVQMPTLSVILVYLARLKSKLPAAASGLKDTRHRVFLATLICAAKYLNDSSPKNMHWQKYAKYFSLSEVNLMEKQMLYLMDYSLGVDEEDVLNHIEPYWAKPHSSSATIDLKAERAAVAQRSSSLSVATPASSRVPERVRPTEVFQGRRSVTHTGLTVDTTSSSVAAAAKATLEARQSPLSSGPSSVSMGNLALSPRTSRSYSSFSTASSSSPQRLVTPGAECDEQSHSIQVRVRVEDSPEEKRLEVDQPKSQGFFHHPLRALQNRLTTA